MHRPRLTESTTSGSTRSARARSVATSVVSPVRPAQLHRKDER